MGNNPAKEDFSEGSPNADIEYGGQYPSSHATLDANLRVPEDAFVRIGVGSSGGPLPTEKKKSGLGSSLKRLFSGKSRRNRAPPPLPTTSKDVALPSAVPGSTGSSHEPAGGPPNSAGAASRPPAACDAGGGKPRTAWGSSDLAATLSGGGEGTADAAAAGSAAPPSEEEVLQMGRYLGLDGAADAEWLWIAAEALTAALPAGWEEHRTPEGDVYYFDATTKATILSLILILMLIRLLLLSIIIIIKIK
jgi:hypothetical protein